MLFWNKLIEYKEIPEKIPEIWHKSPEIPELSKWLGIAISRYRQSDSVLESSEVVFPVQISEYDKVISTAFAHLWQKVSPPESSQ